MKPKNINDQRDSSDFRSKTPFSSSTKMNSASGLLSGNAIKAGGSAPSSMAFCDCQSVQYPEPASEIPVMAAATKITAIARSRKTDITPFMPPSLLRCQSDNSTYSPSTWPDQIPRNRADVEPLLGACSRQQSCTPLTGSFTL